MEKAIPEACCGNGQSPSPPLSRVVEKRRFDPHPQSPIPPFPSPSSLTKEKKLLHRTVEERFAEEKKNAAAIKKSRLPEAACNKHEVTALAPINVECICKISQRRLSRIDRSNRDTSPPRIPNRPPRI